MSNLLFSNLVMVVWPEAVERAFMEAIAEIPKLGRRKVPLHEKHYGRNELIAAYIYRETKQQRTRKQVSSHIQVLKNTRKEDLNLMELLSDGSVDDSNDPAWIEAAMNKIRKIFGEDRLQDSPASPTSPTSPSDFSHEPFEHLDKRQSFEEDDDERKPQHNRQLSIASILNPEPENNQSSERMGGAPFGSLPGHDAYSSSSSSLPKQERYSQDMESARLRHDQPWRDHRGGQFQELGFNDPANADMHSPLMERQIHQASSQGYDSTVSYLSERHMFWPCYFKLTLEESRLYTSPGLPQLMNRESILAERSAPFHDTIQSQDVRMLDEMRFPRLREAFSHKRCLFLRCKMALNLGTCSQEARLLSRNLFQSRQQLTVRCDTTVYSFGKEVVGSMETKQATCQRDRFMYDFRIVDAWLEKFLLTLRCDGNSEEMESSLQNMTIVQEFSNLSMGPDGPDGEPRLVPLLVVAYEFSAGHGEVSTYQLTSGPPTASVRARSHTWDHPMSPWPDQIGPWTSAPGDGNRNDSTQKRPSLEFEQEWPPQQKKYRKELRPNFNYA
ncbi:hypothetical protein BGX31_009338 [Mortierella sp. GBA43]|nr:hypothetical protein BGX31_009338 [Mortierella sp. GBA43]